MYKTKIDWCDSSWNPVTGCLHGCEYCYARRHVNRFGKATMDDDLRELDEPYRDLVTGTECGEIARGRINHYPFGFAPTFHRYRLGIPAKWSEPRTIFVGSMTDLFGSWVPDEWIQDVFAACAAAPWHRYLFLTKNPMRIRELYAAKAPPYADNFWFGSTLTTPGDSFTWFEDTPYHGFVSIEPILEPFGPMETDHWPEWVIVGAETGKRKDKVVPEKWWIDEIAAACAKKKVAIFMKSSIRELMGPDFKQEYPWEVRP